MWCIDVGEDDLGLVAGLHQTYTHGNLGAVTVGSAQLQRMAARNDLGQRHRVEQDCEHLLRRGWNVHLALRLQGHAVAGRKRCGRARHLPWCRVGGLQQRQHASRRERQAHIFLVALRAQRIGKGIGYAHRGAHVVALAQALGPQRGEGRRRLQMHDHRVRCLAGGRHQVVGQRARLETAVAAVAELLQQGRAQTLGERALNLAVGQCRVEQPSSVMPGDVAVYPHRTGVWIDLQAAHVKHETVGGRCVDPVCRIRGAEHLRRPEGGLAQARGHAFGQQGRSPVRVGR